MDRGEGNRIPGPGTGRTTIFLLAVAALAAATSPLRAADGQPDLAFHAGGAYEIAWDVGGNLYDYAQDVAADASGNLFVVGYVTAAGGDFDWGVAQIDVQGVVHPSRLVFNVGGTDNDEANGVVLDAAGRAVVAGTVDTATSRDIRICRFLAGTVVLDSSFGAGGCGAFAVGSGSYATVRRVARAGDGGFIVGGTITQPGPNNNFFAVKFDSAGAVDSNFGFFGIRVVPWDFQTNGSDVVNDMAVDRNGSILLAGTAQYPSPSHVFAIAKLTSAGNLDPGFAGGTGKLAFQNTGPYFATAVTIEPTSGTSFVAGAVIDNGNNTTTTQIGMFSAAGGQIYFPGTNYHLLDETWNPSASNFIRHLEFQSDGKLLITGDSGNGTTYRVSRLNASGGSLDPTFGVSGVASYAPSSYGEGTGAYTASAGLSGGRSVVVGDTLNPDRDWLVLRLTNALIFRDGFETGDFRSWSAF